MHNMAECKETGRGVVRAFALLTFVTLSLAAGAGSSLAHAADGHPVRIHGGTCQSLGPVAFSLTGLGATVDLEGNTIATPQPVNAGSAYRVMSSDTTIDTTVDDLLASAHTVMLYDNDENMQAIACGNVGGAMLDDTLVVGLGEAGVPGHVGFALFQPDGEKTDVTILIGHAMAPVSATGSPANMGKEADQQKESEEHCHADVATPEA